MSEVERGTLEALLREWLASAWEWEMTDLAERTKSALLASDDEAMVRWARLSMATGVAAVG